MDTQTLTFLINNRNYIRYDESSNNRCGKLWIHENSFKILLDILKKVHLYERDNIINSICQHYELQNGDVIVIYNKKISKAVIMYSIVNKKPKITVADYTIDKDIGIFNNKVFCTDNFNWDYWNI